MDKSTFCRRSPIGMLGAVSLLAMTVAPAASVFAATSPTQARIGAADRMETAVQIANQEYPSGPRSKTVVIASGANANLIDSITVAPLAEALGAPILLTQSASQLSATTKQYLTANAITTVVLVGAAANSSIPSQLPATVKVWLISGADRYKTAAKIAAALKADEGGQPFSSIIVASGEDTAMSDALAAAPYAARVHIPVLLAAPHSTSLPSPEAGFVTNNSSQTAFVVETATGYGLSGKDTVKTIGIGSANNYANAVAIDQQFQPTGGYTTVDVANDVRPMWFKPTGK